MGSRVVVRRRGAGLLRSMVLAGGLAALSVPGWAANTCPWMNEATASGLLGAQATGTFTPAAATEPASCVFQESGPGAMRTLTITVETSADGPGRIRGLLRQCHGTPGAMRAIGNEAEECETIRPHKLRGELAVGRVREQVFSIAISTTMKNDPVLTPQELENRIATAAEQVAGNLY